MSLTLCIALFLQLAALVIIRSRLGRNWLQRPFSLLAIAAVIYNGASEVLLTVPAIRAGDIYRIGISQQYVDAATLYMSIGLLVMAIFYVLAKPERAISIESESSARFAARGLDWRLCAVACVPLAVLTYQGRGYNRSLAISRVAGTGADLAATFLLVLIALAAFGFLLRHGMRWFVPVLVAESVLLGAAGERLPIIIGAVELFVLLARVGLHPSRRQIEITISMTLIVVLGVTGYRAVRGRSLYHQDSGLSARAASLAIGFRDLINTSSPAGSDGIIAQAAHRFDGDAFAGAVLQGLHQGNPTLGPWRAAQSTFIVIPSFLWSSKLKHSGELSPTGTEIRDFHLQNTNFLPTMLGLYLGFLGPFWQILLFSILGLIIGGGERRLFRGKSPVHLVVLATAVQAALTYEEGLPGMLVAMRTAVVLAAAARILVVVQGRSGRRDVMELERPDAAAPGRALPIAGP